MAYFDMDEYFLVWLAEWLPEAVLQGHHFSLMGIAQNSGIDDSRPGATRGYIIRDWFGPFLFGPPSHSLRGHC